MLAKPVFSVHATLTGATPVSWRDSIEIASSAGFKAIDVVLPELATEPLTAVAEQLSETGLIAGPASLPVEFRATEHAFRRDLTSLERYAKLAAQIGVKTMFRSIPASSHTPARELRPILRQRLSLCASILQEHGIDFAVEPIGPLHRRQEGPCEFIWKLPDAAEFALSCGGNVGLLIDSWHWHHAQGTAEEIIELGDLVRHVHVADAANIAPKLIRDEQRLLPGDGIIDHATFAEALRRIAYSRFISPEIRGYECPSAAVTCAEVALLQVERSLASTAP